MSIYRGNNLIAGPVLNTGLTPDPVPTEGSPRHVMSGGVYDALLTKEDAANKTTVVDASSTDDQYPSAKAVYGALGDLDPVDIEYARDLYAPDWSQAVTISQDALQWGYRAPKRGIFIGSTVPYDIDRGYITINGLKIAYGSRSTAIDALEIPISLPVSSGDTIKSEVPMMQNANYGIYFVPYKAQ